MTDVGVAVGGRSDSAAEREPAVASIDAFAGFDDWYVRAWPRLQRMLTAYCGSPSLAVEAAAEACVRMAERWPDMSRRPRSPDAWAATVAFNQLKRQRQRSQREEGGEPEVRAIQAAPNRDLDLTDAITRLPQRMRQAVVLRYIGDFTEAAVAETMGTSTGNVASTLHEARRRIQRDAAMTPRPDTDRT